MAGLITKLHNAQKADMNLFDEVFEYLGLPVYTGRSDDLHTKVAPMLRCGAYESAALALVREVLPGWAWQLGTCSVSDDALLFPDYNCPQHGERLKKELGEPRYNDWRDTGIDVDLRPSGRPAIAMCIALLLSVDNVKRNSNDRPPSSGRG